MNRFHETQAEDLAAITTEYIIQNWTDDWCEGCTVRNCPEDFFNDKCPRYTQAEKISETVTEFMRIIRKATLR